MILIALFAFLAVGTLKAEGDGSISMTGHHKFLPQDDLRFADPAYDDSHWPTVDILKTWRQLDVGADAEAGWYRIRVDIPPDFRFTRPALHIGMLLLADETYVNGTLVGGHGTLSKPGSAWRNLPPHLPRLYPIPVSLLKPGEANLIAIRIQKLAHLTDGGIAARPVRLVEFADAVEPVTLQKQRYASFANFFLGIDLIVLMFAAAAWWRGVRDRAMAGLLATYSLFVLTSLERHPTLYRFGLVDSPLLEVLTNKAGALLLIPLIEFFAAMLRQRIGVATRILQGAIIVSLINNPGYSGPVGKTWYLLTVQAWTLCMLATFALIGIWIVRAAWRAKPYAIPLLVGYLIMAAGVLVDALFPAGPAIFWFGITVGDPAIRIFLLSLAVTIGMRMFDTEQALQRANARAVQLHERERGRLARDVHDGVGQWLTTIKLNLKMLQSQAQKGQPPQGGQINELVDDVTHAIEDTRRIAHDLSPALLQKQGLAKAMRSHADRVSRANGVEIVISAPKGFDLPETVRDHLYRIFQEALRNAVEHGGSTHIVVELQASGSGVTFSVSDNGVGLAKTADTPSFGLQSMAERASLLGGTFSVNQGADGGTQVKISIPKG